MKKLIYDHNLMCHRKVPSVATYITQVSCYLACYNVYQKTACLVNIRAKIHNDVRLILLPVVGGSDPTRIHSSVCIIYGVKKVLRELPTHNNCACNNNKYSSG